MDVNMTYIHTHTCLHMCTYVYDCFEWTHGEASAKEGRPATPKTRPMRDVVRHTLTNYCTFSLFEIQLYSTQSLLKGSYLSLPFMSVPQFCTSVLIGQGPFAQEKWTFRGLFALLLTTFSIQLFLSWVPNTQLNHWTKRVVSTRLITGARGNGVL